MYSSSYSGDALSGGAAAGVFAFLGFIWLITLAIVVIVIIGMWKVFVKAGQPGWAAIVPIYNIYVLTLVIGRPAWWVLLYFVGIIPVIGPIAVLAVTFVVSQDLARSFGKEMGFGIGLWLLGPVFYPILGFGSAQYVGPRAAGFGLPDASAGGYGGGYPGGGYGGTPGYTPPAGGYQPPAAPTYAPPAPTYAPPAPPAAPAPPAPPAAAPTYAPPAPPAAAPPAAPTYQPPAAPTYQPPAAPEPPAPPAPPAPPV